jgi:hypothetical protein
MIIPAGSMRVTLSPVLLRMALVNETTRYPPAGTTLPAPIVVCVPPGVSSSMRQPLTSIAVSLGL